MSKEQAKVLGKVINHSMTLRRQIQQLRIYADDDERCFIPQKPLYKLLTKEALRKVLISCHGVLPYYLDELVEIISKGARKIFAILILLRGEEEQISRFVQSDGFQRVALDHKLPFPKDTLCEFLPSDAIDDFCRLQWEFIAPIFCKGALHRMLNARTRLPFVTHCDTGEEGGFGHIYDLEIHPEYQRFPDGSGRTVSRMIY